MKRASISAVGLFLALSIGGAAAQMVTMETIPPGHLAGARSQKVPGGTIVVPSSNASERKDAVRRVRPHHRILIRDDADVRNRTAIEPMAGRPPSPGLPYETPASLACIYGLVPASQNCIPDKVTTRAVGGTKAVAIVDAYHYPHAKADLTKFSRQFGLPLPDATNFRQINLAGASTSDGWGLEASLDIEMAHAMAPGAAIILVEAKSDSVSDMIAAVDRARRELAAFGGGQVSMSWGTSEWPSEAAAYDGHFVGTDVVYFASTGDAYEPSWPAVSSRVVAVGGTSVVRDAATLAFRGEASWAEAGSGFSSYIARPSFQLIMPGTKRGIPDIAADADPNTGAWVYFTAAAGGGGWYLVGGTSVSAPLIAGIVNHSRHNRASSADENTLIYVYKALSASAFRISRPSTCGAWGQYSTASYWNPCTGVGSPRTGATQ